MRELDAVSALELVCSCGLLHAGCVKRAVFEVLLGIVQGCLWCLWSQRASQGPGMSSPLLNRRLGAQSMLLEKKPFSSSFVVSLRHKVHLIINTLYKLCAHLFYYTWKACARIFTCCLLLSVCSCWMGGELIYGECSGTKRLPRIYFKHMFHHIVI